MDMGQVMIVAGLGSRRGVTAEDVMAAIRAAVGTHGLPMARIGLLATGEAKSGETAFAEAALRLGLPLEIVSQANLAAQQTPTRSTASLAASGVGSMAEAAALAAAGDDARLLGPRTALGPVTCAIAEAPSPQGTRR
jgi:cobalt-precorrin 5A hydrolase